MPKKPPPPQRPKQPPPPETAPFTPQACDRLSKMQAGRVRLVATIEREKVNVKAQQDDFDLCGQENPERKKLAERLCDSITRLEHAKAAAKALDETVWVEIAQACQNELEFGEGGGEAEEPEDVEGGVGTIP